MCFFFSVFGAFLKDFLCFVLADSRTYQELLKSGNCARAWLLFKSEHMLALLQRLWVKLVSRFTPRMILCICKLVLCETVSANAVHMCHINVDNYIRSSSSNSTYSVNHPFRFCLSQYESSCINHYIFFQSSYPMNNIVLEFHMFH